MVITGLALILLSNCSTSSYITDNESRERQEMIRKYRTGINLTDVALQIGTVFTSAEFGVDIAPIPESRSFTKMKLINESSDTMIVNMVTDRLWRDSTYCDIREIVIPPSKSAKFVTPLGADYNVYFRKDFDAPEDEKIEINTAKDRVIRLGGGTVKK